MTTPWIVAFIALSALVLLLGLVVSGLLRRITPLIEESQELLSASSRRLTIGGLPPGATVPRFEADEVGGGLFTDQDLRGQSVVLFLDDGCDACGLLVTDLASGAAPDMDVRLVVVSNAREAADRLARSDRVTVIVDDERSVARAFESVVSPQAFVVDEHGMALASGTPNTWDEMRQLIDEARGGGRRSNVAAASVASSNAEEVV